MVGVVDMGAILGTVPGWERAPEWTSENRIYRGPSYIKYDVPPRRIEPEKRYEYKMTIDVTIYLCDTPDLINPIVVRMIKGIKIISVYEEEYPGGLDQWISDISIREAEELLARSNVEVAGLVPCERSYDIKTYDEEEILPIKKLPPTVPRYILEQIEYLESRYREAETVDERLAIREEINRLKERYGIM